MDEGLGGGFSLSNPPDSNIFYTAILSSVEMYLCSASQFTNEWLCATSFFVNEKHTLWPVEHDTWNKWLLWTSSFNEVKKRIRKEFKSGGRVLNTAL